MYLSSTVDCVLELKTDKIKALHKFQNFSRKNAKGRKEGATIPFFTVPWWETLPLKSFSVILVWRFLFVEFPLSVVLPALQVWI